ncbi:hypothetical protein C0Q70_10314 [Pomacea canaliculata]|uniref:Uncharacterized protein n=1 Tax=Pomacea canaliculata TaxID=400727 RepID=A0A2T7PC88_POMCA|nr:hypothetical protein C0Q70_10314 [Pomacea canaliculata]
MAHRLVGLGAGCPLVHVTGASSSTSSQIQQLLTSIANSTSITTAAGQPTSLLLTSAIASSSGLTTTITTTNSAGGTTTSASAGRVLVTTAPRTKLSHAAETTDHPKAIQRLQFHDFPLTTASLQALSTASGAVFTQAKILEAGRSTEGAGVRPAGVGGTAAVMKVGVSKSLINPGSLPTSVSSILSRVVAQGTSQAGVRAGSPLAGTSILGGKSTVLITSLGKTFDLCRCRRRAGQDGDQHASGHVVQYLHYDSGWGQPGEDALFQRVQLHAHNQRHHVCRGNQRRLAGQDDNGSRTDGGDCRTVSRVQHQCSRRFNISLSSNGCCCFFFRDTSCEDRAEATSLILHVQHQTCTADSGVHSHAQDPNSQAIRPIGPQPLLSRSDKKIRRCVLTFSYSLIVFNSFIVLKGKSH